MKRFLVLIFLLAFCGSASAQDCKLSIATVDQMKAATKAQIITAIGNKLGNLTKEQLIRFVLKNCSVDVDEKILISDPSIRTGEKRGPIYSLDVQRDILGNKVSSVRVNHVYYPKQADNTEPVDTITIEELNSVDVVTKTTVLKHSLKWGENPTTTVNGVLVKRK